MDALPGGLNLTEVERLWIAEAARRLVARESVDERAIKVALLSKLPTDFQISDVRSDLWRGGKLSIAGLALALPGERLVSDADLVLKATREILVENPTSDEISADEIGERAGVDGDRAGLVLRLLSRLTLFHRASYLRVMPAASFSATELALAEGSPPNGPLTLVHGDSAVRLIEGGNDAALEDFVRCGGTSPMLIRLFGGDSLAPVATNCVANTQLNLSNLFSFDQMMGLLDEELSLVNQAAHSGDAGDLEKVANRLGAQASQAVEVWRLLWPKVAERPSVKDLAMTRMFRREEWSREPFIRAIADILVSNPAMAVAVRDIMEGRAIGEPDSGVDVRAREAVLTKAEPTRQLLVTEILADRYDEFEVIAETRMSTVYRCRAGQRTVAFKSLDPTQFDEKTRKRLRREIRLLRDLDHPNVVSVHAHNEATEPYWYEMEYTAIGDLKGLLPSLKGDTVRIHSIFAAICDGLKYLHSGGPRPVVHRDLKPGNILMFPGDHPKIADAGLARLADRESASLTSVSSEQWGTDAYIAPEQMLDFATADARSDIYSLGVVLFEMFVGHTKPHWVHLPTIIPAPYDAVIARMLEPEADNRYQTVDELFEDLDTGLSGLGANGGQKAGAVGVRRTAVDTASSMLQAEEALDLEVLRDTLSDLWPHVHRLDHEPYDVLLNDLNRAGVTSRQQLEELIRKHRDDVLRRAAREAEFIRGLIDRYGLDAEGNLTYQKSGVTYTRMNMTPEVRDRANAGLHYGHVALTFTALQFDSGERSPDDPLD